MKIYARPNLDVLAQPRRIVGIACLIVFAGLHASKAHASPLRGVTRPGSSSLLQQGGQLSLGLSRQADHVSLDAVRLGEKYGIALAAWDANGANGKYISEAGGSLLSFDGSRNKSIEASRYRNQGDEMLVDEFIRPLPGGSYLVQIDVFSRGSDGALTNWLADGSRTDTGDPFAITAVEIGDFNAPADKLAIDLGDAGGYELTSAEYWFIGTQGGLFGPGGEPFEWYDTSDQEGVSGVADFNLGSDISTASFEEQEFAGFSMRFEVAPVGVPEPMSLALLATTFLPCLSLRRS